MLKKLIAALGIGIASNSMAAPHFAPYTVESSNIIYNLLFCDDFAAFKPADGKQLALWQQTLFSEPANISSLEALSSDQSAEGRVRYLAFSKLRTLNKKVQSKKLLGVIIEVPLSGGLDTLAVYSEGGVRYINHTGKLAVIEGVSDFQPLVQKLFEASIPVVNQIGPWDKSRLSPPKQGNVRLTFLVSDGLYFGEGPMNVMQNEAMAGPVIQQAAVLLQAVVKATVK
jgi:hypothetical protein